MMCRHLSKLKLIGHIKEDPHQSHHVLEFLPSSIVKLTLDDSMMIHDPMGVLEKLPCLRILKLESLTYDESKIICFANGFPQLDALEIRFLPGLKECNAMPLKIGIGQC
ncbi:hypothetical protein GOBAR_AA37854 [Gossypium barbadense]|uniref:FBD domain-containing protein n=1 Tax=Gossypium barbadense TaxID=3634 RepID=A0A2P5VVJ6_GOSBA|nr:hypothetical protein GOBAR_AA37854 [Gossypium barbadense]